MIRFLAFVVFALFFCAIIFQDGWMFFLPGVFILFVVDWKSR